MSGEGTVTIGESQWAVSLATTPAELSQGLGGISSIPAGTGMLFDVGVDQVIEVTTEPMLFSIDIVWIHSTGGVVEVARGIGSGYLVTPTAAARYFLEVNAGEAADVEVGDTVAIDVAPATGTGGTDLSALVGLVTQIAVFGLTLGLMGKMVKAMAAPKKRPVLYGPRGELLPATSPGIAVMPKLPREAYDDYFFREYIRDSVKLGEEISDEEAKAMWEAWTRRQERLTTPMPAVIGPTERREPPPELEFFADSSDHIRSSMEHNGIRPDLEQTFREAIERVGGIYRIYKGLGELT